MSEPMIIANKYNEIITDLINDTVLEQNEVTIEGQVNHYAYNVDNYMFVIDCYTIKPDNIKVKQITCFVDPELMTLKSYADKKVTITGKLKFWYDQYNNNYQIGIVASKLELIKVNNKVAYFTKINDFIKKGTEKIKEDNIDWETIKNILIISDKEGINYYESISERYQLDKNIKVLPITTDFDKLTTKELLDDINYGFKYCDMIVIFYDNEDMDYEYDNIIRMFNKQSIVNQIKNSPIPIITLLDNTDKRIASADFASKNFISINELFDYLLGMISEGGIEEFKKNKIIKVYLNRLLKMLVPDINKYLDMVDEITSLFLDPEIQTELSTFNEIKEIMIKFFDTFIIDVDRMIELSDNKILLNKCKKLKKFMIKKNIKKLIKIIDDLMKDLNKYVIKYGKSNAELLEKTDEDSESENDSDSDY